MTSAFLFPPNTDLTVTLLTNGAHEGSVSFSTSPKKSPEDFASTSADCSFGPMERMVPLLDRRLLDDPGFSQLLGCARACRMSDICFDSIQQRVIYLVGDSNLEGDDVMSGGPFPQTEFCNFVDTLLQEPIQTTYPKLSGRVAPHWLENPTVVYSPRPLTAYSVATSPLHLWFDELSALWRAADVAREMVDATDVHILVTGLNETQLDFKLGWMGLPLSFITGDPQHVHFAAEHNITCLKDSFININPFRLGHPTFGRSGGHSTHLIAKALTLWSSQTYARFYASVHKVLSVPARTKSDMFMITIPRRVAGTTVAGKSVAPSGRIIANLDEILESLIKKQPSFRVAYIDFAAVGNFVEQQRQLRTTRLLLGIQGSQFVHACFMLPGTAVISIIRSGSESYGWHLQVLRKLRPAVLVRVVTCDAGFYNSKSHEPSHMTPGNLVFNAPTQALLIHEVEKFAAAPVNCSQTNLLAVITEVHMVLEVPM